MADSAKLALTVNGQILEGFESGNVTLTMEGPVNSFALSYVADGRRPGARVIYAGDECDLTMDAGRGMQSLIKGYIDATEDDDDPYSILLQCSGRSKTADLEDCSARNPPGIWKRATVSQIATAIAKPYGVSVHLEGDEPEPLEYFAISNGESAYDAIQRAASIRLLNCYSVSDYLVLAQAGPLSSLTTLERGKNVVRSSRTDNWQGRYSDYVFLAQCRSSNTTAGRAASQLKATSKDRSVSRYRLLVQTVSTANSQEDLQSRADIEVTRRAGLGEMFQVVTSDWGNPNGNPWRPNTLVHFKNEVLGVDTELIICTVRYSFGANSAREAELTLMRPEAFLPEEGYPVEPRGAVVR